MKKERKIPQRMQVEALREALLDIFYTESIAGYHVDTAAEILSSLPREKIAPVLSMVRLIAYSVSDLLAFSFIENVEEALKVISVESLGDWVEEAISIYEEEGLYPAKEYLSRAEETAIRFADERRAVSIDEVSPNFRLLIAGLSERNIQVKASDTICTDTENIYAPRIYSRFEEQEENRLFYRVLFVHKCSQIRYKSFHIPVSTLLEKWPEFSVPLKKNGQSVTGIEILLKKILDFKASPILYALMDTIRIEARLADELPGLARELGQFKEALRREYKDFRPFGDIPRIIFWVMNHYSGGLEGVDPLIRDALMSLLDPESRAIHSAEACKTLLERCADLKGLEFTRELLPYIGTVKPGALSRAILKRREECRERFINILSAIILDKALHGEKIWTKDAEEGRSCQISCFLGDEGVALIFRNQDTSSAHPDQVEPQECLVFKDEDLFLNEELKGIVSEIESDLGSVPNSYVSGAVGLASGKWASVDVPSEFKDGEKQAAASDFFYYDEWDFRRKVHRKNWCTLKEMDVPLDQGGFVELTLKKYRGQVLLLRRQFEMLRPEYNFLRRQSEGEEIDLDAIVEAFSDFYATGNSSENLFVRLNRSKRDIVVSFLVDMSASTEGWVNTSIKEALILLCEALQSLGDRYSIYGFSGMRRTGCQFFKIKDFHEPYDSNVKARISGINARAYTRMGPAIRHSTELFQEVDARLKILVVLSDGKPQDYDEYKGPYAIEDTRMSLIEAKEKGIRPFCITIDKTARDYIPHMYGEVNYIMVKDVRRLYKKVADIYRLLTT